MITGSGGADLAQGKKGAFYNTLEEFHKYWDRIDVICLKIPGSSIFRGSTSGGFEVEPLSGEPLFGNVYIHPSPWPLWLQPFWIFKKGKGIYHEQKFELVTAHEYPPFYNGVGARLLWQNIRIPYVLEIHHVPGYPKSAGAKEVFYKFLTHFFIKHDAAKARAVRVVNQKQVPEFLKKAGVPAEKIKYIPSAYIDLEIFKPIPEVEKKYDLVFAGRLEKNKGIDLLLQAMSNVKAQMPNVELLLIGQGPELNRIKLAARTYNLGPNIVFSGWLETAEDVAKAYNSARIFVNPSLNEGGPRVVLEAMACGLPVITTRVGLMLDIIKNGENGFLIDWNPHSMADRILYLLHSENLQKQFSAAGLELVKQFEKKAAIKNFAQELQNLI